MHITQLAAILALIGSSEAQIKVPLTKGKARVTATQKLNHINWRRDSLRRNAEPLLEDPKF